MGYPVAVPRACPSARGQRRSLVYHIRNYTNVFAKHIRVVTNAYATMQTHSYSYEYDMQDFVAGRVLKDMDSLVTNTFVCIRYA